MELENNAKHKQKGVLNYYKSFENGEVMINILYDVFGVTYYYKEIENNTSAIMNLYIDGRSQILFPVNADDLFPKKQNEIIDVSVGGLL